MSAHRLPLLALLGLAAACAAPEPPPAPPAPQRVESPDLGIAVAALPAAFAMEVNSAAELTFRAAGAGLLTVDAGPELAGGINLVQEVWDRKAAIEGLPDGEYFGNLELVTPIGRAYTARGAWSEEGDRVEAIWAYAIHPAGNRLLTLTYRYPAGESSERMGQLVELIGEIEAMPAAATR